jgi:hypothetical protein
MYRMCGYKENRTALLASLVNGAIWESGRSATVDQKCDSSVIVNTEIRKVDLHNNVTYTILQLEYMQIICKRVVTIFSHLIFLYISFI